LGLIIPLGIIASQPDLGTALVSGLALASIGALLVRRLWPFWVAGGGLLLTGTLFWQFYWERLEQYQQRRIVAFLDPSGDPTGIGWQTQQSLLAVGSGRVSGKGFREATQSHFQFLPEYWTDFPFSVWAEEWGFFGCVFLLGLMMWLVLRILSVAAGARDVFGAALCLGVGALLFWHTIVNVAMVLGMAPVVGLTLPFISYGGSSLFTFLVGLGLVCSVASSRKQARGHV